MASVTIKFRMKYKIQYLTQIQIIHCFEKVGVATKYTQV